MSNSNFCQTSIVATKQSINHNYKKAYNKIILIYSNIHSQRSTKIATS